MLKIKDLKVLYEDNHLIAVNKPAGWLVQGDDTGDTPLSDYVKAYIKKKYNKPGEVFCGVIHRLDRPVSGAVIFARTSKGLSRMNELFRDQKIHKEYLAITKERPDPIEGAIQHYLLKDPVKNRTRAYEKLGNRTKHAKLSKLTYKLIAQIDGHCLLRINPLTGRPHQIRVQLSEIGCPIKGDFKYGFQSSNQNGSIFLHCNSMSFMHPIKQITIEIEASVPNEFFWRQFKHVLKER